ncbi:MAG TPA: outer membrane beta-barrel family protein [Hanamia sp.]
MQKIFCFTIASILLPILTFCQSASSIKGNVSDSSIKTKTAFASVSVLDAVDSVLVSFTRTDENGNFKLADLNPGKYIILITYPEYADFAQELTLKPSEDLDFNHVYITPKSKLMEAIVIRQAAMRIKGDTTEYVADSFAVKPNATVEDLLKEMPGITVDKDGKITQQGKQIQKVLVDGDEFFSDDPTIATRNLRADAIDKVQVFDKKSDQAEFTGIDDGQTTKTLNLKLKSSAKNGYFGKVSVGGLDQYYNAQALINAFKAKRKISAFVITSTSNATGLNFMDANSLGFGGGGDVRMDGGGAVVVGASSGGSGDMGTGNYNGQGLPQSVKAGALFSNKWDNDKYNVNANYLFNQLGIHNTATTFNQNTIQNAVYYTRDTTVSHSDKLQHALKGIMEIQLDSSSSFKVNAGGFTGTNNSSSLDNQQYLNEENQLVNSSMRNTTSTGANSNFSSSAIWRKKYKKVGRTISITFDQKYNQSNSDGLLINHTDYYDSTGLVNNTQETDQKKLNNSTSNVLGTRVAYTEPLSKKAFVELNYSFYNNSSVQKSLSYNLDVNNKYTILVDSLSSDFKYIYNTNSGGVNFRYNEKKYNFSAGGNIANTAFQQTDLFKDTARKYSYFNLFPQATLNYKFNSFSNIRVNYNGSTTQPTIDQLQPLKNNNDPLNIVVGNPDLRQQFTNTFGMNYSTFEMMSERFIFLGVNYSTTKDQISNSYTIDDRGNRVTKYINVDGNYNLSVFGGFNMKIPKSNWRVGLSPNAFISQNTNFANNVKNLSNNLTFSPRISLSNRKNNVYELNLSASPAYTTSKSSINPLNKTKYWTYTYSVDGSYMLPGKLEIGSNANFSFSPKLNALAEANNVILWNAYLEKKFLKNDVLTLRASINDILDQNKGYSRNVDTNNNAITEQRYLTFQRYGMLTLTYNFNNKGGTPMKSKGPSMRF